MSKKPITYLLIGTLNIRMDSGTRRETNPAEDIPKDGEYGGGGRVVKHYRELQLAYNGEKEA